MLDDLQNAAANALPPPREDEPPALRQEILDELADHFACAYRRELLRTRGDAELSKRNVRDRFGDPAKIARKLWFDAMKGKLMAQKIMVFATCLSVVLMAVIAFMGWRLVEASQQATSALIARSQETNAALLAQSEKTHAAILARLEAQGEDGEAGWSDSLEWSEFELKFVEEGTGEPATDVTVNLSGPLGESSYQQQFKDLHPNANGVIDMSPLHIGDYSVTVRTAWDASSSSVVHVRPGHDFQKTYTVPTKPTTGKVDLDIKWPERLRGRDLWAIVGVTQMLLPHNDEWRAMSPRFFAVRTDGRIIDLGKFYKDQGFSRFSGGLGGYGVWDGFGSVPKIRIARAAFITGRFFQPGLDRVPEGIWSPQLLGIYPEAALPDELNSIAKNPVWIGIGQKGATRTSFSGFAMVPELSGFASVNPKGKFTSNGPIYWYPGPAPLTIEPNTTNQFIITIPEQVANAIPEEMLPPRAPVEAPRRITMAQPASAVVTIRCVYDSSQALPIEGAVVRLLAAGSLQPVPASDDSPFMDTDDTASFAVPPRYQHQHALWMTPPRTNANGLCWFQGMRPGKYRVHVTLPSGDRNGTLELLIEPDDRSVEKTIICPEMDSLANSKYQITWPELVRDRTDIWLVLELSGQRTRQTESGSWSALVWHLVAINPAGETVIWKERGGASSVNYHGLAEKWGDKLLEQRLLFLWDHMKSATSEIPVDLANVDYRILGVGIARWDGTGSPDELLAGIRDGRYRTPGGGAFFYALREIAPMKAKEELPTLTMGQSDEGQPTLEYTVPESLVQSALRRWDGLPVASK